MADAPERNVILGAVRGYGFGALKPFLYSLAASGFNGEVVFYTSGLGEDTERQLDACHVGRIGLDDDNPLAHIPVNSARYFVYQAFLREHGHLFSRVMLADVRDIYFQRDPFDFEMDAELCCFLEDPGKTIGTCEFNAHWIMAAYGPDALQALYDKRISCSGTTIGTVGAMNHYLDTMVEHLIRLNNELPAIAQQLAPVDQGVHNYILNNVSFPSLRYFENEDGPIMAFVHKSEVTIQFDDEGRVLNEQGDVVNVLHQYDRHEKLVGHLLSKLSAGNITPPA